MSTNHVLCLNSDYRPLKVVGWQQAILMLLDEKADLVNEYVGKLVRSAHVVLPWPAVIRLRKHVKVAHRLRFSRQNILARDSYTCAYCGGQPKTKTNRPDIQRLTLDHVVPRAQSRNGMVTAVNGRKMSVTCWENVVTACESCNSLKADRTPAQAGMRLRFQPRIPSTIDLLRMSLTRITIPTEWADHLPGTGWGDYWTATLDPG